MTTIATLASKLATVQTASETRFTMLAGSNCFYMLLGFALLEAGSLRARNLSGVMLKEFVVACVVGFVWYLWGHGMAFGSSSTRTVNNFIGTENYALSDTYHDNTVGYVDFFFQMTFASVAASIVSGAIGERMKFQIYFFFLFLMAGWIYPVVAHSQWASNGWNSPFNARNDTDSTGKYAYTGAIDAAGCGAIHIVGGVAAFIGAWMCKPRAGRFNDKMEVQPMPGHNSAFVTMGVMVLWFGWFSFNSAGKINDMLNHHLVVARSSACTVIAAAVGGLTTLLLHSAPSGFSIWPLGACLNGALTGLVAVTAGSTVIEPWGAFIIGIVSSLSFTFFSWFVLEKLHVDDPVDAFAVHFGGGTTGLFWTGLLASPSAVRIAYGITLPDAAAGAFMGGDGTLLGYQILLIVFATLWCACWTFLYLWIMDQAFGIRISADEEEKGTSEKFGGEGYDYLSPLQQVDFLNKSLAALRSTMMDGTAATAGADGLGGFGFTELRRRQKEEEANGGGGDKNDDDNNGGDKEMQQKDGAAAPAKSTANDDDDDDEELNFNDAVVPIGDNDPDKE